MRDIPDTYEEKRMWLFFHSFVGKELRHFARYKIQQAVGEYKKFLRMIRSPVITEEGTMRATIREPINKTKKYEIVKYLGAALDFSEEFLLNFIAKNKLKYVERNIIYNVQPNTLAVLTPGYYIKVDAFVRKKDVQNSYDTVQKELGTFKEALFVKPKREQASTDDIENLRLFLMVDRAYEKAYEYRNDEEYKYYTINENIDDIIKTFSKDKNPKYIRKIYRYIQHTYRIPTLKSLKRFIETYN